MPVQNNTTTQSADTRAPNIAPTIIKKRKHLQETPNSEKHSTENLIYSACSNYNLMPYTNTNDHSKKLKIDLIKDWNSNEEYLNEFLCSQSITDSQHLADNESSSKEKGVDRVQNGNCVTIANGITVTTECNAFNSDSDLDLESLSEYRSTDDDNSSTSSGEYGNSNNTTGKSILGTLLSPVFSFLNGNFSSTNTLKSYIKKGNYDSTNNDNTADNHNFTQLTNFATQATADNDEHLQSPQQDGFEPYSFIRNIKPPPPDYQRKTVLPLPTRRTPKMCLVLDLDETLVHCSMEPFPTYNMTFECLFDQVVYTVFVKLRPHLQEFLEKVSQWYEVILFTASQRVYADKLINLIDPKRTIFRHRLFREHCLYVEGTYIKDLNILGKNLYVFIFNFTSYCTLPLYTNITTFKEGQGDFQT